MEFGGSHGHLLRHLETLLTSPVGFLMEVPFHKHGSSHHQLLVVDSASSPAPPQTRGWG